MAKRPDYPPFGSTTRCPKCRCEHISSTYNYPQLSHIQETVNDPVKHWVKSDYDHTLTRTCCDCGWQWHELPADHDGETT